MLPCAQPQLWVCHASDVYVCVCACPQELARRLKTSAPEIAEIFLLLSRDEARHAGFINKVHTELHTSHRTMHSRHLA